jgi:hypothetical protein
MMTKNPLYYGSDATAVARAELLKNYDLEIVRKYEELNVMDLLFPGGTINDPGADSHNWDILKSPKRAATSRDGETGSDGSIAFDIADNKFVVTNQNYELKFYSIERARRSNRSLDMETARAVGSNIAEEKDYQLWNGNTNYGLTSIKSAATDAGPPSGVWDVEGKMYTDILTIVGKIRQQGYNGILNAAATPGINAKWDEFVTISATETLSITYGVWLKSLMRGGNIWSSSNWTTANTGPRTTRKATGSTGTAINQILIAAPGAGEIINAHGLISVDMPAKSNNIKKDVSVKYTSKIADGSLIAYMDAIDLVT